MRRMSESCAEKLNEENGRHPQSYVRRSAPFDFVTSFSRSCSVLSQQACIHGNTHVYNTCIHMCICVCRNGLHLFSSLLFICCVS